MNGNWKTECSLEVLRQRAFLMSEIRGFFANQNVLEVETPILSSAGNTAVNIESFSSASINSEFEQSYLRTSPEFPLKRLLCSGIGDIFELGKVFRRGEISKTHNVEFTMLEWYRIGFGYVDLIKEVALLFEYLFSSFKKEITAVEIKTFKQSFKEYLGLPIDDLSEMQLNQICKEFDYDGSKLNSDECLDYLFATQIQPKLAPNNLTFVTHYPASQAALAEIDPDDGTLSLRFEVFHQSIELGNGYQELTDAEQLQKRFEKDNQQRRNQQQVIMPIDHHLLTAMKKGMPKCSGIAIGVDRLLMLLLDKSTIQEVLSFHSFNS